MSWWNKKYNKYSDEELILQICEKNETAFRELYARYNKALQRYFYRMLYQDIDLANDALQELFIKVFEKADQFKAKGKFSTWLYSIANNQCKNYYRKNDRRIKEVNLEEDHIAFHFTEIENSTDHQDAFNKAFQVALQQLPENQKELFILRYQESFSIKEISEITNIAEGTIKSGLHRITKKLSKALTPFHPKNIEI